MNDRLTRYPRNADLDGALSEYFDILRDSGRITGGLG